MKTSEVIRHIQDLDEKVRELTYQNWNLKVLVYRQMVNNFNEPLTKKEEELIRSGCFFLTKEGVELINVK